jgi:hypothetical protein
LIPNSGIYIYVNPVRKYYQVKFGGGIFRYIKISSRFGGKHFLYGINLNKMLLIHEPSYIVFLIPDQLSPHGADKFCSFLADETENPSNGVIHEVSP